MTETEYKDAAPREKILLSLYGCVSGYDKNRFVSHKTVVL